MKKAALTIGLFSLMMVATSFSAPEKHIQVSNFDQVSSSEIEINVDGSINNDRRRRGDSFKLDQSELSNNKLNSFASDSQVIGRDIKVD